MLSWNLYTFIGENFNQFFPYCNLTTATNGYKLTIEFGALMVIDIIVLTLDILITIFNKKSLQRYLSDFWINQSILQFKTFGEPYFFQQISQQYVSTERKRQSYECHPTHNDCPLINFYNIFVIHRYY